MATVASGASDSSTKPILSPEPADAKMEATYANRATKIGMVIALYWVVSISMVFLNKYLLSSPDLRLDAPLFITWFQCLVAIVACWALPLLRPIHPFFEMFPRFEVKPDVAIKCLPLSAVFVGMIAFNNLCLKEIGVSFYNVGRSLTTIWNVLLTYLMLGQKTSPKALLCCLFLVLGFILGVDQEGEIGDLSVRGVLYGVLASLFVALNAIYVKKILPIVEGDSWKLTLYNNLNAFFLFVPLMIMANEHEMLAEFDKLSSVYFWAMMTLGGIFGVAIGLVTMLQIKFTSPLTHNISGTAKACAQTVIAVWANAEVKSGLWWLSNALVLLASAAYTHVRSQEMQNPTAAPPTTKKSDDDAESDSDERNQQDHVDDYTVEVLDDSSDEREQASSNRLRIN
jgi:GDP-fucose transporter C1